MEFKTLVVDIKVETNELEDEAEVNPPPMKKQRSVHRPKSPLKMPVLMEMKKLYFYSYN